MRAIITFHTIDNSGSLLSFPPDTFSKFLSSLKKQDLDLCDLDTLLDPATRNGICITFDDGLRQTYRQALPILRDYDVPAHVFLNTENVGGMNDWPSQPSCSPRLEMLNWGEIEKLYAAGIYIESHTNNHPDLRGLDDAEIVLECETADKIIENRLGRYPRYFAYPYGLSNERVRAYTRDRYKGCVTTELRYLHEEEDMATLPRLDSYYLKQPWLFEHLASPIPRTYLLLRRLLRNLRAVSI
ncbi:MAG: polysaccharide deacetylase family protein [Gammaproteobacteria bacterium]|nr:polysaccharide deacetylase family protein [Gammaproteobacteria bacterium]